MSKQDKPYYLRSTSPYDIEINLDELAFTKSNESAFTKSSKIPRSPPPAPPKKELSKSSGLDILRSASTPNISSGTIPKNPLKQTRLCTSAEPISKPAISVPVTSSLSAEHIPKVPEISTIYEEIEVNSRSAANWFRTFAKRNPEADWNHTVREFKIKFIGPSYQDDLEYSLIGKRQLSNQGIREFFYEIIDLCDEVDPEMSENTIMRRVIAGLLPYYRHMINISRPKSLGDLEEDKYKQAEIVRRSRRSYRFNCGNRTHEIVRRSRRSYRFNCGNRTHGNYIHCATGNT
ncbi:Retrotransposon gag protein [Popillia japonica]|uniref:Retrotransposon gag protein n=1 Tax=Popillia japonica TaxID=7064 RepID=A0AAW1JBP3_POPJA